MSSTTLKAGSGQKALSIGAVIVTSTIFGGK